MRLILLRHGQSAWNAQNRFTGWVDIPLTARGIEEALAAGKEIAPYPIDRVFTSTLIRGVMTAFLALLSQTSDKVPVLLPTEENSHAAWAACYSSAALAQLLPVISAWQLNERMYGELQGCNKEEMRQQYGPEQVHLWRRSFAVSPPGGESLKMTAARTLPYFYAHILPCLEKGEQVLVAAHGNSLRALVMALEGLSEEEIVQVEIPTGKPLYYAYAGGQFRKEQERQ